MRTGGIQDQHHQATFAIRALAHVTTAISGTKGRSVPARLALLGASLAVDVFAARRAIGAKRHRLLEVSLDLLDAGAWSRLTGDSPATTRPTVVATVVPAAMETGFRLGAGTDAVPVVRPERPWRPVWSPSLRALVHRRANRFGSTRSSTPASPTGRFRVDVARLAEVVVEVGVDVVPPLIAMSAVRRRRGLRTGAGAFGWAALAAGSTHALARGRAKAQSDTTLMWDERTAYLLADARIQSRVQSALMHNLARVDPKGMLAFLERAGSRRAGIVLDELSSAPGEVTTAARERGLTLSATVDLRRIDPPQHRIRWVAEAQVRHIRNAIGQIDASVAAAGAAAPSDDVVTVVEADARRLVLEYRGSRIVASQPTPQLVIRLEPTIPGLLGSSAWTLSTALPAFGSAPLWAAGTATGMQWFAAWRLASREALERRGDRFTAVVVSASTLLLNLAIARSGSSSRPPVPAGSGLVPCPATGATQALTLLVGGSWNDLPTERWWLIGVAALSWAVGSRRAEGLGLDGTVTELAFLVMPALASATIGDKTRREAQALETALRARLGDTIEHSAREEAREQVRRFADQLRCVIDELPLRHPGLDDAEVDRIVADYQAEHDRIVGLDPLEAIGL